MYEEEEYEKMPEAQAVADSGRLRQQAEAQVRVKDQFAVFNTGEDPQKQLMPFSKQPGRETHLFGGRQKQLGPLSYLMRQSNQ